MAKKKFIPRTKESVKVIRNRWSKKRDSIETLSENIQSLRYNVSVDLKSDNEKIALTALVVAIMMKTSERVGNDVSASQGHVGITGLKKKQVNIIGNKIILEYVGKSGVEHDKFFSDERIAKALKQAKKNSPNESIFVTSKGFKIKNNRINRFLSDFKITSKVLRGYSANSLLIKKLKGEEPEENEKKRLKQFNRLAKVVALKVGHGLPTLKKHYLVPELEPNFVERGEVVEVDDLVKYNHGGSVKADDKDNKVESKVVKKEVIVSKPVVKKEVEINKPVIKKVTEARKPISDNGVAIRKPMSKKDVVVSKPVVKKVTEVSEPVTVDEIKLQIMKLTTKAFKTFSSSIEQLKIRKEIDRLHEKLNKIGGKFENGGGIEVVKNELPIVEVKKALKVVVHNNTNSTYDKVAQNEILNYLKNNSKLGQKVFFKFLKESKQSINDYDTVFILNDGYHPNHTDKYYTNKIKYTKSVEDAYLTQMDFDLEEVSYMRVWKKDGIINYLVANNMDLFGDYDGDLYDERGYLKKEVKDLAISKIKKALKIESYEMKNGGGLKLKQNIGNKKKQCENKQGIEKPTIEMHGVLFNGGATQLQHRLCNLEGFRQKQGLRKTFEREQEENKRTIGALCDRDRKSINKKLFGGVIDGSEELFDIARSRKLEGVSSEKIFYETGYFIGLDGKWRTEIDDYSYNFKFSAKTLLNYYENNRKIILGNLIKHDDFFTIFPKSAKILVNLRDITEHEFVKLYDLSDLNAIGEFVYNTRHPDKFNFYSINLYIDFKYIKENGTQRKQYPNESSTELVILHELQHIIQSQRAFRKGKSYSDRVEQIRGRLEEIRNELSENGDLIESDFPNQKIELENRFNFFKKNILILAFKEYEKDPAEVEARSVVNRYIEKNKKFPKELDCSVKYRDGGSMPNHYIKISTKDGDYVGAIKFNPNNTERVNNLADLASTANRAGYRLVPIDTETYASLIGNIDYDKLRRYQEDMFLVDKPYSGVHDKSFKDGGSVKSDYVKYLIERNLEVDIALYKLDKYLQSKGYSTNGLVPDKVRDNDEYKKLKKDFNLAFSKSKRVPLFNYPKNRDRIKEQQDRNEYREVLKNATKGI